jgi:O-antigen ligase
MKRPKTAPAASPSRTEVELVQTQGSVVAVGPRVFAILFGAFLGLALIKFGNPPIMERWVERPTNIYEFLFYSPWPIAWAYTLLGMVLVCGIIFSRTRAACPTWLLVLPAAWYVWQRLAASESIERSLSVPTVHHFTACLVCLALGGLCLSRSKQLGWFWLPLGAAFLLVVAIGWQQHFGGLAETRRYFELYVQPQMKELPPGYLKKMTSERIFSTLFYPNTLAGALLLFFPSVLAAALLTERLTKAARVFCATVFSVATLACMFWSGSKGGWLLMMFLGFVLLLKLKLPLRTKAALIGGVLLLGLGAFAIRHAGYFGKGATSAVARGDYWRAAIQITKEHPWLGTGPGTFFVPYSKIKKPQSEPARLTHNDYLEQASDSGIPGAILYLAFISASIAWTWRKVGNDWRRFALWLGVLGFALHSTMEFSLYIPALAWSAFAMLGWLLGVETDSETSQKIVAS